MGGMDQSDISVERTAERPGIDPIKIVLGYPLAALSPPVGGFCRRPSGHGGATAHLDSAPEPPFQKRAQNDASEADQGVATPSPRPFAGGHVLGRIHTCPIGHESWALMRLDEFPD